MAILSLKSLIVCSHVIQDRLSINRGVFVWLYVLEFVLCLDVLVIGIMCISTIYAIRLYCLVGRIMDLWR